MIEFVTANWGVITMIAGVAALAWMTIPGVQWLLNRWLRESEEGISKE